MAPLVDARVMHQPHASHDDGARRKRNTYRWNPESCTSLTHHTTMDRVLAAATRLIATCNLIPVDHIPPGVQIIGTAILVLQIVSMFPDVISHDRIQTLHQWAVLVSGRDNRKLAALVENEPGPTGAETLDANSL